MYDFVDTTESALGNSLSSEAVSINGEYIEDRIDGYRTLYTYGRESLEKEFESYDDTAVNGSLTKFTRFPARTITIGFQLISDSPESFRESFNTLNGILNVEDAEIIFSDEQDKFFTGSPVMNADIEPGKMAVKGEFQIYCEDPFKYSVDIQQPQAVFEEDSDTGLSQTFLINYEGTVPAYPRYVAKFYNPDGETDEDNAEAVQTTMINDLGSVGACKYVAFMDDERHVLQFGNPEAEDDTDVPEPLILTNRSFKKSGSYVADASGEEWKSPAKGNTAMSKAKQQGSLGTGAAIYAATQQTITKDQTLLATTSGTGCKYKAIITTVDSRTSSAVKLHVQVKISKLAAAITKGATLTVEMTYGDKTVTKVLKDSSKSWKKNSSHSCSFTMTVSATSAKTELSGIKLKVTRKNGSYKSGGKTKKATGSTGKLSIKTCKPIEIPYYIAIGVDSYYVRPSSYGNAVKDYYTGPTLSWTYPSSGLPATDVSDGKGANAFELTWNMKFCMGKTTNEVLQMGAFECLLLTGDSIDSSGTITNPKILAGFLCTKPNTTSKGHVYLYAEGKKVYELKSNTNLTWDGGSFGNKGGFAACKISSTGKKLSFTLGSKFNKGKAKTFTLSSAWRSKRVLKIAFGFYRYSASPAFDWNGINSVKFKKIYETETELTRASFDAGQVLVADLQNCDVLLDDVSTPSIGALGNDWETMCLKPGINQISTAFEQRGSDAVKVMRRCRADEAYQGAGAYGDDDESTITVDTDDSSIKTYFTCDSQTTSNIFFYASETTLSDGKRQVTASNLTFTEVSVSADTFDEAPTGYFVLEDPVPEFSIEYREVFI